jgi:glycosyltransferase involved in cell wall biosynthesis
VLPIKGYDVLINAFGGLSASDPELNLLILGDGPARPQLEALVRELGLAGRVHLPGRVANPVPYFRRAAACVIASRAEGFPNVLLEMMCVNARVVSTLCAGGIAELKGVVTCPPGDVAALTAALRRTLGASASASPDFERTLAARDPGATWNRVFVNMDLARSTPT